MTGQKRLALLVGCVALAMVAWTLWPEAPRAMTERGQSPVLKSTGPLAFGPDGTLFMADIADASIIAVNPESSDASPAGVEPIDGVEAKIASLLGTTASKIAITDLAVHPTTQHVFLSVQMNRVPALVRIAGNSLSAVTLDGQPFTKALLSDMPRGGFNRGARAEVITDMALVGDRLWVAGLSNEEFSSKLRSIPYPFSTFERGASVEIFHGSHGEWETAAPVYTFVPYNVGGQDRLIAGYLCTPLVMFSIADLTPGGKAQGRTIAELGNMNRPIDMIVYQKDGSDYLLMSNTDRGVMKIPTARFGEAEAITARVQKDRAGVGYETVRGWGEVQQIDRLDDQRAVLISRNASGALDLKVTALP